MKKTPKTPKTSKIQVAGRLVVLAGLCVMGAAAMSMHQQLFLLCVRKAAPAPALPYDAEVEYLESTGTQWIDTGIVPRVGLITEIRFLNTVEPSGSTTPTERTFGAMTGRSVGYNIQRYYNASLGYVAFFLASFNIHLVANGDCEWHNAVLCSSNSGRYVEIDSVRTIDTSTIVPSRTNHLLLFAVSNTNGNILGNSHARIAHCSIRDTSTGQLLLDLISVRKDGVGYMYDRVSGNLLGNGGTGDLVIGPDK